jgi:hypothetical protein
MSQAASHLSVLEAILDWSCYNNLEDVMEGAVKSAVSLGIELSEQSLERMRISSFLRELLNFSYNNVDSCIETLKAFILLVSRVTTMSTGWRGKDSFA